jgi:hypothetical protein
VPRWGPYSLIWKVPGALTLYQSFFAKVSVFFLRPFFPFERRLFLPTAMIATWGCERRAVLVELSLTRCTQNQSKIAKRGCALVRLRGVTCAKLLPTFDRHSSIGDHLVTHPSRPYHVFKHKSLQSFSTTHLSLFALQITMFGHTDVESASSHRA